MSRENTGSLKDLCDAAEAEVREGEEREKERAGK